MHGQPEKGALNGRTHVAHGYRTHGIGKYHFDHPQAERIFDPNGFETRETQEEIHAFPEKDDYLRYLWKQGFRHVLDPHGVRGDMYYMPQLSPLPAEHHPTQWVGDRTVAFLREQETSDRPWMCFASFIHPHPPFSPPPPWHKLYRDLDVPAPFEPPGAEQNWIFINRYQNRYKRFDQGRDGHRSWISACGSNIAAAGGRCGASARSAPSRSRTCSSSGWRGADVFRRRGRCLSAKKVQ